MDEKERMYPIDWVVALVMVAAVIGMGIVVARLLVQAIEVGLPWIG